MTTGSTWAIVLAAGNGTRLASLTTDEQGRSVPKQYCSLRGGPSLLHQALRRARRIVPRSHLCTIVARQHEQYWSATRWPLPARNIFVEPHNMGTAIGILHGVLRICDRDPLARILFFPADHHVRTERALSESVRKAEARLIPGREEVLLIGIAPDEVDVELGYIVPGPAIDGTCRTVEQFVEKPQAALARDLIARGAVWNSFIFGAQASTLLALFRERLPEILEGMTSALARDRRSDRCCSELDAFYEDIPTVDFSRAIAQGGAPLLRVVTAPACGWTDLGTPSRLARVIERLRRIAPRRNAKASPRSTPALVNLAAHYGHHAVL